MRFLREKRPKPIEIERFFDQSNAFPTELLAEQRLLREAENGKR